MVPDLLLVLTGILLVLVPGAAVVVALRADRLAAALRADLDARVGAVASDLGRIEAEIGRSTGAIRDEASRTRADDREALQALRQDASATRTLAEGLRAALGDLGAAQAERQGALASAVSQAKADGAADAGKARDELRAGLDALGERLDRTIAALSQAQRERHDAATEARERAAAAIEQRDQALRHEFEELRSETAAQARALAALSQSIEAQHAALRQAVDTLHGESGEKLEQIRRAIEGELQSARDVRLFDSVKRVSESLDQVHKAVGEMQSLASGSGTLRAIPKSLESWR